MEWSRWCWMFSEKHVIKIPCENFALPLGLRSFAVAKTMPAAACERVFQKTQHHLSVQL